MRFLAWMLLLFVACARLALAVPGNSLPRHGFLGTSIYVQNGIRIRTVYPDSAASRAGLRPGDIINSVNGTPLETPADYLKALHLPAGELLALVVMHDGQLKRYSLRLPPAPKERDPAVDTLYQAVSVDGTLRRVLVTVPHGKTEPFPVLMIVGGIGCYPIDNINPQDAYRNIAHDLGRRGIAVVRLEKSGIGDSQGAPCATVDFTTELHSYDVALTWMLKNPLFDSAHVFLLGHSIGGVIAPRIALHHRVAGIVAAETVGIDWFEYELINARRQLELSESDPTVVDASMNTSQRCIAALELDGRSYQSILRAHPECQQQLSIYPVSASYMRELAELNIGAPWSSLDIPVLAVYGRSDFITDEPDHQRIVDMVNQKHAGTARLTVIDNMDHYLTVVPTQRESLARAEKGAYGVYDHIFSTDIAEWICQSANTHCQK